MKRELKMGEPIDALYRRQEELATGQDGTCQRIPGCSCLLREEKRARFVVCMCVCRKHARDKPISRVADRVSSRRTEAAVIGDRY